MKNTVDNQVRIQELGEDVVSLIEAFEDLPPYEIGFRLIASAVNMMLTCAPNTTVAIKTIIASVEMGMSEYQEEQEEQEESKTTHNT